MYFQIQINIHIRFINQIQKPGNMYARKVRVALLVILYILD